MLTTTDIGILSSAFWFTAVLRLLFSAYVTTCRVCKHRGGRMQQKGRVGKRGGGSWSDNGDIQ